MRSILAITALALSLSACASDGSFDRDRSLRAATAALGQIIAPDRPQKPRKARRLVTKD